MVSMNVLVAAWVGSSNLGDELIFEVTRRRLVDRGLGVATLPRSKDPVRVARAVDRADAVLFGGGGLLQDQTSIWNLPYHLRSVWLARLRRTPYAGYALGAAGISTRVGRMLVSRSLRSYRALRVRDHASARLLAALGIADARVTADPVFSIHVDPTPPRDRVAISLRPTPARSRLLPVSARSAGGIVDNAWIATMAGTLDELCDRTGLRPYFVALQPDRDHPVHQAVAERMRHPVEFARPTLLNVAEHIASARLAVAMRYHAGVLAAVAGRPSVLIGYAPKTVELAADLAPGAAAVRNVLSDLTAIPRLGESLVGRGDAIEEALARLRDRESGNEQVLDTLVNSA